MGLIMSILQRATWCTIKVLNFFFYPNRFSTNGDRNDNIQYFVSILQISMSRHNIIISCLISWLTAASWFPFRSLSATIQLDSLSAHLFLSVTILRALYPCTTPLDMGSLTSIFPFPSPIGSSPVRTERSFV